MSGHTLITPVRALAGMVIVGDGKEGCILCNIRHRLPGPCLLYMLMLLSARRNVLPQNKLVERQYQSTWIYLCAENES